MNGELRRAWEFIARGDMSGERTEQSRFGTAVFADALPLRQDSNYLRVEVDDVDARELVAEADSLARRSMLVRDAELGERLAESFPEGWIVHRGLVMAHRSPSRRAVDTRTVDEVDERELHAARREQMSTQPWASTEWVEQYLAAKRAIARNVDARFFAVRDDRRVVSYTDLYLDGRTAQVEDVATLEPYRGRGFASALVVRAVEEAHAAGCDFVFLVTDADDWPQRLYRDLGFADVGRYVKFFRP